MPAKEQEQYVLPPIWRCIRIGSPQRAYGGRRDPAAPATLHLAVNGMKTVA